MKQINFSTQGNNTIDKNTCEKRRFIKVASWIADMFVEPEVSSFRIDNIVRLVSWNQNNIAIDTDICSCFILRKMVKPPNERVVKRQTMGIHLPLLFQQFNFVIDDFTIL